MYKKEAGKEGQAGEQARRVKVSALCFASYALAGVDVHMDMRIRYPLERHNSRACSDNQGVPDERSYRREFRAGEFAFQIDLILAVEGRLEED